MDRFLFIFVLMIGICRCPLACAEEKMVTTPLLTALSSTTISGYVDTSAHWNPVTTCGTTNFVVTLRNHQTFTLTIHDILILRSAIQLKQFNFFQTFIAMKLRLAELSPEVFDAKFLPLLISISGASPVPARRLIRPPSPSAY